MAKAKKSKKQEQTVVMTIEATFILKDRTAEEYAEMVDVSELVPGADKVDIKNIKVFERDE